jgi:murein DD-endopeptidase MepM/ murein hydrolase activator NlpD
MRMSNFVASLSSIRASIVETSFGTKRARSIVAAAALSLAVSAAAIAPSAQVADARSTSAVPMTPVPFLTLPFAPNGNMHILSGWYYSSSGGFHGGIDFINGGVNSSGWRTFPVIASADGEACGNCTSRQGNAVWVKHNIGGRTFYTYYGHLASISKNIPRGSQSNTVYVHRGDVLGMAGDTGASGALHLHFALYNASSVPMDPYAIGKLREAYPTPNDASPGIGWFIK